MLPHILAQIDTAKDALVIVDTVAQKPPLWWFVALIIIGLSFLGLAFWILLKRIGKLERELTRVQTKAESYLRDGNVEMVAALTKSAAALERSNSVIEQNSTVYAELALRLQIAQAGHHAAALQPHS